MRRSEKQFTRHAQVAGEKRGEVEGFQFRVTHRGASSGRNPCVCDFCTNPAAAVTVTRSGVYAVCPVCADIAFMHAAQPLSIERFHEGEREHEPAYA